MDKTRTGILITFIFIIIGALLIGGATVALFTSTAENTHNTFQAGALIIELDRDNGSLYFDLTDIAPGDHGSEPVIITNTGTLDLDYQIAYNLSGILAQGQNPLQIQFFDSNNLPIDLSLARRLTTGEEETITVTWEMPLEAGNEYQGGTATFDLLINATQVTGQGSSGASHYAFRDLTVSDFQASGNWSQNNQGFMSNFGLLFIPNNRDSYILVANTTLHQGLYSNGTSGGYGLFFETTLSAEGAESGYILQFDRGYGAVTIRRRVNGSETSPIISVNHQDLNLIPADKNDPWWTQSHQVEIEVNQISSEQNNKSVRVSIDNIVIIENFIIDGVPQADNHTGLRSWHASSTFIDLSIQ